MKTIVALSTTALAILAGPALAYKDDSYYIAGTGNPNVNEKMYWKDAENVFQDLGSFQELYVEFQNCAWSWMQTSDEGNDIDENDYWYMGKIPPMGANVAFSLYGSLKGESFSGCNENTFINSFYTNTGFTDFAKAMNYAGVSGFSGYSSYSATCSGYGYGVGCDWDNGFAVHYYSGSECNPSDYKGVKDTMSSLNSAMKNAQCIKIFDRSSYSGSPYGTPLELLAYSHSCFYQDFFSPDGVCPDPYGKLAYYQQQFYKGIQESKKQDPYQVAKRKVLYEEQIETGKSQSIVGLSLAAIATLMLLYEFLSWCCCGKKKVQNDTKNVPKAPLTMPSRSDDFIISKRSQDMEETLASEDAADGYSSMSDTYRDGVHDIEAPPSAYTPPDEYVLMSSPLDLPGKQVQVNVPEQEAPVTTYAPPSLLEGSIGVSSAVDGDESELQAPEVPEKEPTPVESFFKTMQSTLAAMENLVAVREAILANEETPAYENEADEEMDDEAIPGDVPVTDSEEKDDFKDEEASDDVPAATNEEVSNNLAGEEALAAVPNVEKEETTEDEDEGKEPTIISPPTVTDAEKEETSEDERKEPTVIAPPVVTDAEKEEMTEHEGEAPNVIAPPAVSDAEKEETAEDDGEAPTVIAPPTVTDAEKEETAKDDGEEPNVVSPPAATDAEKEETTEDNGEGPNIVSPPAVPDAEKEETTEEDGEGPNIVSLPAVAVTDAEKEETAEDAGEEPTVILPPAMSRTAGSEKPDATENAATPSETAIEEQDANKAEEAESEEEDEVPKEEDTSTPKMDSGKEDDSPTAAGTEAPAGEETEIPPTTSKEEGTATDAPSDDGAVVAVESIEVDGAAIPDASSEDKAPAEVSEIEATEASTGPSEIPSAPSPEIRSTDEVASPVTPSPEEISTDYVAVPAEVPSPDATNDLETSCSDEDDITEAFGVADLYDEVIASREFDSDSDSEHGSVTGDEENYAEVSMGEGLPQDEIEQIRSDGEADIEGQVDPETNLNDTGEEEFDEDGDGAEIKQSGSSSSWFNW